MTDIMGVSEHLKKKLVACKYAGEKVIGSGCTMIGNPVRDMHLSGGKNKITQGILNKYIAQIDDNYECKLKTFEDASDFVVYIKLKDEVYQSLINDEPTEVESDGICPQDNGGKCPYPLGTRCSECEMKHAKSEDKIDEEYVEKACADLPEECCVPTSVKTVKVSVYKCCIADFLKMISCKNVDNIIIYNKSGNLFELCYDIEEE